MPLFLGGLLLALEEGVSFWNLSLMWNMYLYIITTYFTSTLLQSVFEGVPGMILQTARGQRM